MTIKYSIEQDREKLKEARKRLCSTEHISPINSEKFFAERKDIIDIEVTTEELNYNR